MDIGKILLNRNPFCEIVIGNAAIVRAMIEAGVDVVTTYPGSPTPEIADAVRAVREYEDIFYFEYSVNEKVASEVAFGASVSGSLSVVFFKSVGLNVAADSFVQFSLMDLTGGMVIILGDDPGANSSQNEQDNRHYARMTNTPILEPADPQQAYEMFLEAAQLSVKYAHPVILRMTTHVCHSKSLVCFAGRPPAEPKHWEFNPDFGQYIPLTAAVAGMKKRAIEKLQKIREFSEECRFNSITVNGSRRGIITCGLPSLSLNDVMAGMSMPPDILRIAMPWPLPVELLLNFCEDHDEILILEELDPFIENEVKAAAFDAGIKTAIIGKTEPEDFIGELTPSSVRRFLRSKWPDLDINEKAPTVPLLAVRPAQMCPGCGHRSAFFAVKKALTSEDITVADIGCHTLGFMEPYNMGKALLSMGHSCGTASGISLNQSGGRTVCFLGDSTFFHAGLPGIINAVYNNHNITLIVMENGTTAMTGHQDHAGSRSISIKAVLESLGAEFFGEIDTYNQAGLTDTVRKAVDYNGFSVLIAKHPCMLKFTRDRRHKGKPLKSEAWVDTGICENIQSCISEFACPSFNIESETRKIYVNKELCIGDGSCVQTCPVEAVSLKRKEE